MPFQAWIRVPGTQGPAGDSGLQWGHALSGMDTCVRK